MIKGVKHIFMNLVSAILILLVSTAIEGFSNNIHLPPTDQVISIFINGEFKTTTDGIEELSLNPLLASSVDDTSDFLILEAVQAGHRPLKVIFPSNFSEIYSESFFKGDSIPLRLTIIQEEPHETDYLIYTLFSVGFLLIVFLLFLIFKKDGGSERRKYYERTSPAKKVKTDKHIEKLQFEDHFEHTSEEENSNHFQTSDEEASNKPKKINLFVEDEFDTDTDRIPDFEIGAQFFDYKIEKIIGRGGIATIYKAVDIHGNEVAIKVMTSYLNDGDMVGKFFNEGYVLQQIKNKFPDSNIVNVFTTGKYDLNGRKIPYLIIEYIDGQSLEVWLKNNKMLTEKMSIASQIADALNVVHSVNVVHRDLSPENILIRKSTLDIVLIDFGVARYEVDWMKNTSYGAAFGKPKYMSPEQFSSPSNLDYRSDYYSFGILLYKLFVGKVPFDDTNIYKMSEYHQNTPVPDLPESTPTNIKELIYRLLEKKPENRPSNINEIKKYLKI